MKIVKANLQQGKTEIQREVVYDISPSPDFSRREKDFLEIS